MRRLEGKGERDQYRAYYLALCDLRERELPLPDRERTLREYTFFAIEREIRMILARGKRGGRKHE